MNYITPTCKYIPAGDLLWWGAGFRSPKRMYRVHRERREEDRHDLRVNWNSCQHHFIEKRLHLSYCIVAHGIKQKTKGLAGWHSDANNRNTVPPRTHLQISSGCSRAGSTLQGYMGAFGSFCRIRTPCKFLWPLHFTAVKSCWY